MGGYSARSSMDKQEFDVFRPTGKLPNMFSDDYEFTPENIEPTASNFPPHMQTDLEEMDRLTNETQNEHLVIFDLEGNQMCDIISGERYGVSFTDEAQYMIENAKPNSLIVVHTHPSPSPFSKKDIENVLDSDCESIHTNVVIGRGNIVYSHQAQPLRYVKASGKQLRLNSFERLLAGEEVPAKSFNEREIRALQPFFDREERLFQTYGTVWDNFHDGRYERRKGQVFTEGDVLVSVPLRGEPDLDASPKYWANQASDVLRVFFTERVGTNFKVERLYND